MISMKVSLIMPRTFFRPWGVTRFSRPERGGRERGREGGGRYIEKEGDRERVSE